MDNAIRALSCPPCSSPPPCFSPHVVANNGKSGCVSLIQPRKRVFGATSRGGMGQYNRRRIALTPSSLQEKSRKNKGEGEGEGHTAAHRRAVAWGTAHLFCCSPFRLLPLFSSVLMRPQAGWEGESQGLTTTTAAIPSFILVFGQQTGLDPLIHPYLSC